MHQKGFTEAIRNWRQSRFGFAAVQVLVLLLLWSVLRAVLFWRFHPASNLFSAGDFLKTFLIGLHLDLAAAAWMIWPLLLWLSLFSNRRFNSRGNRVFFAVAVFAFWSLQTYLLSVEYYFFDEFKSRFNTVAIDYLIYPQEVFVNIWDTYPIVWILLGSLLIGFWVAFFSLRSAPRLWQAPVGAFSKLAHLGAAAVLTAIMVLSANFQEAHFGKERVLNEIANNGAVSFVAAAWSRNLDYTAFYLTVPKAEAYRKARELLSEPGAEMTSDELSTRRHIAGDPTRPKYNVIIFLEESLGSEFWGSLGRKSTLTPCLDKLTAEGLLFENLYATGNRTVRGFEGVLSSFPPLPGDSIVKRDRSDEVETIARVLKRDGYKTMFLYGGRGLFDGMGSFASHNGYDRFIEQKDFAHPAFSTIWGVCNEDLYGRTLLEMRDLNAKGQPFFTTVLSVSNHKPYTYPAGRIPEDPKQRSRENAVKYTDWCLGQFFEGAKKEAFWTNTIFVVVADHGARVYGSQTIPIHSYEIPLLILGPAAVKEPARLPQLGCQLDVAPTILGLLGRPYDTLFYGHDLLKSPPRFALFNHNRDIGIYRDNHLVILNLNQKTEFYHGDPKTEGLVRIDTPDARDLELRDDAVVLFQTADDLYMNRKYTLEVKK